MCCSAGSSLKSRCILRQSVCTARNVASIGTPSVCSSASATPQACSACWKAVSHSLAAALAAGSGSWLSACTAASTSSGVAPAILASGLCVIDHRAIIAMRAPLGGFEITEPRGPKQRRRRLGPGAGAGAEVGGRRS